MFSTQLEHYINQLADVHHTHADSLAIALINCVAATLEFSQVLRANCFKQPMHTNIYNLVVARSCKSRFNSKDVARNGYSSIIVYFLVNLSVSNVYILLLFSIW